LVRIAVAKEPQAELKVLEEDVAEEVRRGSAPTNGHGPDKLPRSRIAHLLRQQEPFAFFYQQLADGLRTGHPETSVLLARARQVPAQPCAKSGEPGRVSAGSRQLCRHPPLPALSAIDLNERRVILEAGVKQVIRGKGRRHGQRASRRGPLDGGRS